MVIKNNFKSLIIHLFATLVSFLVFSLLDPMDNRVVFTLLHAVVIILSYVLLSGLLLKKGNLYQNMLSSLVVVIIAFLSITIIAAFPSHNFMNLYTFIIAYLNFTLPFVDYLPDGYMPFYFLSVIPSLLMFIGLSIQREKVNQNTPLRSMK